MLIPWKESYNQPRQHIKKQRHYFTNNCPSSQSYGFPVVMYECESWSLKKAEHWRIDAFELWCWRRLLRVPWTAKRSNQSILKEISHEYSLEGLTLKLKLQYFGHLMWRPWCWERLRAGEEDDRGWDGWMASLTQWTQVWANSRRWWRTGKLGMWQSMGSLGVGHNWATSLSLSTFMHWRRRWQPTPAFLPGESQGREPGGLLSMGSHRVGHDWSDLAAAGEKGRWKNKDYIDYIYKTGPGMMTVKRNLFLFMEVNFRLLKFKIKDQG